MKRTTQTTTINGRRVRLVTTNGKVTIKPAPVQEWLLQAEAVRRLRAMPEYASAADNVRPGTFTLAGDFNAGRRGKQESVKAKATGLTPGEHDVRVYMHGGRLGLIEMKGAETVLRREQKERHALLAALGFKRQAIIREATADCAANEAVKAVRQWLAENDNAALDGVEAA